MKKTIRDEDLPPRGTGESRQAWRERCRFLAKQLQAKQLPDPRQGLFQKDDGLYMRLDIEGSSKGFRIRQVGTDNFLRGPNGTIIYFPTELEAFAGLQLLKDAAERKAAQDGAMPVPEGTPNAP